MVTAEAAMRADRTSEKREYLSRTDLIEKELDNGCLFEWVDNES
jgi:hypothetical protein